MWFLYIITIQACASLEPNYQPPVTFIVVQKRHHTRLFANNHRDRSSIDKSGNILPGEILVSSKIVSILLCIHMHNSNHHRFCNVYPMTFNLFSQALWLILKSVIQRNSIFISAATLEFR